MGKTFDKKDEWREVAGWPYEVSGSGRVRRVGAERELRRFKVNGYPAVNLSGGGRRGMRMVHWLVAEAFIGPRPSGLVINHRDANRENNRPENLEYVTQGENVRHCKSMGRLARGSAGGMAKLTEPDVGQIALILGSDTSRGAAVRLARRFGVTPENISAIKRGLTWAHVTNIPLRGASNG